MNKKVTLILSFMLALAVTCLGRDFVVVIDPGHGGKDAGCVGRTLKEKDIVLDVAKRLGKLLSTIPSTRVIYTRDTDRFISLQQRTNIANNAHADIFISLHVNSVDASSKGREQTSGMMVFTMGPDKSDQSLKVAMRENSVIELEPDYSRRYRGFDPKSAESYISMEMSDHANLKSSIDLARSIQRNLHTFTARPDKGCHQAGFWVLWHPAMPSVLVELEFICNPEAERWLATDQARDQCAKALFESVKTYHKRHVAMANTSAKPSTSPSKPVESTAKPLSTKQQTTTNSSTKTRQHKKR